MRVALLLHKPSFRIFKPCLIHKFQNLLVVANIILASSDNNTHSCTNKVVSQSSWSLWHARLGHANSRDLKSISHVCKIPMNNKKVIDFFNSYFIGKSHKLHAPLTNTNYIDLFDLTHTGLWGPSSSPLSGGYTYYIAFVDVFSRYTWIYFL